MVLFKGPDVLVVVGIAILLLNRKRPNRPGGPRDPMHPSPAGDDSLLRPNSRRKPAGN